jgi:(p)ppGpp synthase/HD superfamily hydrolase
MSTSADTVQNIKNFADFWHASQNYGSHPYSYHLKKVRDLSLAALETIPFQSEFLSRNTVEAVAWGHDLFEDTEITPGLIQRTDRLVHDNILLITDPPGPNRKARKIQLYQNMEKQRLNPYYQSAFVVKLADRLANVIESVLTGNSTLQMYKKEQPNFERYVYLSNIATPFQEILTALVKSI